MASLPKISNDRLGIRNSQLLSKKTFRLPIRIRPSSLFRLPPFLGGSVALFAGLLPI